MSFDEIRVVFESRKRKFNSRILEKDGLLHSIDVDRKYSVVSVIVPSISHYWISIVEDNRGYNMTDAEYRYYAKKLDKITYDDIIKNGLKVMDTSACALCKQNNIPIIVFDFERKDGICKILNGNDLGTYISL